MKHIFFLILSRDLRHLSLNHQKYFIKTLICMLIFSSSMMGQHLGFSIDGTGLITTADPIISQGPSGLSVLAGYSIINNFEIETRVGYQPGLVEYSGIDAAILLNYYFIESFYITGGFMYHSNLDTKAGKILREVELLGVGAGIQLTKVFSFEVIYFRSLEKEPLTSQGISLDMMPPRSYTWLEYLTGVIRVGLKFHWSLL